jgi:hypothetical protein
MASSSSFAHGSNPFLGNLPSPFGQAPEAVSAEDSASTYAMIASAPPIDASEVETSAAAVEVVIKWQDTILHVGHLTPARSFFVGDADGCDAVLPGDKLGTSRAPIVLVSGTDAYVVLLPGAQGTIQAGGRTVAVADAIAEGVAVASPEHAGAHVMRLVQGMRAQLELGGFSFEVAAVNAGRKVAGKISKDKRGLGFTVFSASVHAGLFAAMFAFMPSLSASEDGSLTDDQQYALRMALATEQNPDEKKQESPETADVAEKDESGGSGKRAMNEEGKMGSETSKAVNKAYAVQGDEQERMLSRARAIQDAQSFGMIAMLEAGDPLAPTSPWGTFSQGSDALSANGNMWGAELGEAGGFGGLGLSGTGIGGGGKFEGVGLGVLGTIGNGSGTCVGSNCQGFGSNSGRLSPGHATGAPKMRPGVTNVSRRAPELRPLPRLLRDGAAR